MRTASTRRWITGVAAVTVLATGSGMAAAAAGGGSVRGSGPDYWYGASVFSDADARVHAVHNGAGGTVVTLHVTGVAPSAAGAQFGAHVHAKACGAAAGDSGGHYQHAGAEGSLEDREVWLDVVINEAGNGHAVTARPWALDIGSPRSVVIHALATAPDTGVAGPRLACIDIG